MAAKGTIATLQETLQDVRRQLKEDHVPEEVENFNKEAFWTGLLQEVSQCRDDMQQVCLTCEKLSPQEILEHELIDKLKRDCREIVSTFAQLPRSQGLTLRHELSGALQDLFSTLTRFTEKVSLQRNQVGAADSAARSLKQAAASCLEKFEAIEKVPRDNKEAVCSLLAQHYEVVDDAVQELSETLAEEEQTVEIDVDNFPVRNGFNHPRYFTWTPEDRGLLDPGLGLIKAVRIAMRKAKAEVASWGQCTNSEEVEELDRMADLYIMSSSYIDEFITSLYPPVFALAVRENASELRAHARAILRTTRHSHFHNRCDDWISFMESAVEHNFHNVIERSATL